MNKKQPINKVSSASDWKQKSMKTYFLALPSGTVIEYRHLRIMDCIASGYIPLNLFQSVMVTSDKMTKDPNGWDGINQEDFTLFMRVVRKIAAVTVISPKVSEDPNCSEDEIHVNDIPDEDLIAVFGAVMAAQSLVAEPFRK